MSGGASPSLDLSVSVEDLADASHLKSLLQDNAKPLFTFAAAIAPLWRGPIKNVPDGTSASFGINKDASWQTGTGICLGLSASAKCTLDVVAQGALFSYRDGIETDTEVDMPADDYAGCVYLRLSISFEISGSVSGSGNIGAVGISGNAKGTQDASLIFCHRVPDNTILADAVRETLGKLVFPFHPTCAADLAPNDIAQATFNGTLKCSFDLSYGIASLKFCAPSVTTAVSSLTKGIADFQLPSGTINVGASANVGYEHSDDFAAIVQKLDPSNVFLYVMRAHRDSVEAGVKVAAKVDIDQGVSVAVDSQVLARAVNHITGVGGEQVAAQAGALEEKLTGKVNDWINETVEKGTELSLKWEAERGTCNLFKYKVDLSSNALPQSWRELCLGDLRAAVQLHGLLLQPGSGIDHELSRSFTIDVHFFNYFSFEQKTEYFNKAKVFITDTGDIRYIYDIGIGQTTEINQISKKCRVHFVASADLGAQALSSTGKVELWFELSETGSDAEARHIGAIAAHLYPSPDAGRAYNDMQAFITAHPSQTLNLRCIMEPSAYGKISCSEQPDRDQTLDSRNWNYFHNATMSLLDSVSFAKNFTYKDWRTFNRQLNDPDNSSYVPNRRESGPWGRLVATGLYPQSTVYYFWVSTDFMNLCDDLHHLADKAATTKIPQDSDSLLKTLKSIITTDVDIDFAKPAVAALLDIISGGTVDYEKVDTDKALTCTLTIS